MVRGIFGSAISKDVLKELSINTREHLSKTFPGEVINNKGRFLFSERTQKLESNILSVIKTFDNNTESIRLPEYKSERSGLVRVLISSMSNADGNLNVFCPVCPDYGKGSDFYRTMGEGLSPEARAGVEATKVLLNLFPEVGLKPKVTILVADTEDDLPEVIENCTGGSVGLYKDKCQRSVNVIGEALSKYDVNVTTFTHGLGDNFRATQYLFEQVLRKNSSGSFANLVKSSGSERSEKHSQILGRRENNFELTFRYMAQYAALGHILRTDDLAILMNYQTPNRKFYNASTNVNRSIILDDRDYKVVPVIGTVVRRQNI